MERKTTSVGDINGSENQGPPSLMPSASADMGLLDQPIYRATSISPAATPSPIPSIGGRAKPSLTQKLASGESARIVKYAPLDMYWDMAGVYMGIETDKEPSDTKESRKSDEAKTASDGKPPPVSEVVSSSIGVAILDEPTITRWMDRSASRDLEIQREAIRSLANAAENPENQLRIATWDNTTRPTDKRRSSHIDLPMGEESSGSPVVDLIGVLILSRDPEVAQSAAILAQHMALSLPLLVSIVVTMLNVIHESLPTSSVARLVWLEVKRRVACALATIVQHHKSILVSSKKADLLVGISRIDPEMTTADSQIHHALQDVYTLLNPRPALVLSSS